MYPSANTAPPKGGQWTHRYTGKQSGPVPQAGGNTQGGRTNPIPDASVEADAYRRASEQLQREEAQLRRTAEMRRQRIWRDSVTAVVAVILTFQVLGTGDWISWTPGLLLHGGWERVIDFALTEGYEQAQWLKLAWSGVICLYWLVLLLACSRLGQDAPPAINPARELSWSITQRRVAYIWPIAILLVSHAIGAFITSTGWWVLAIPFELGGHIGMATVLYLLLVPEARRSLMVVEDFGGKGVNSRVQKTAGLGNGGRRWDSIPHDRLRGVAMHSPLWARLLGVAHVELTYLATSNVLKVDVIRAAGSTKEVAIFVAKAIAIREGRPLLHTLPPSCANTPQPPPPPLHG